MGAKQLSKSAWESQLKKNKLEEKVLSKALGAFEKCDEKDHEAQEKALAEVEKAAEGLKKDKKFKEVADYVGEVFDAAKEERKAVAKAAEEKEKEEEGEDEETAEYKKDLPKQLKGALNKVKSLAPGDPPPPEGEGPEQMKFIAYLAGAGAAVFIGKKVGSAAKKLVAGLSGASGGKYVKGECIFEKNAHTFVVEKVPGGLRKKIAAALEEETGQKYKVRVRGLGGEEEDDEEDEGGEGAVTESGTTGEKEEKEGQDENEAGMKPPVLTLPEIIERLKEMKPDIDRVIAGAVPSSAAVKTLFVGTATLAKAKNEEEAQLKMEELEAALAKGLEELAAPKEKNLEAAFKERLAGLMPKIKEAIAAGTPESQVIKLKAVEAGALAKQGDFTKANGMLDQVEVLLGAPPKVEPTRQEKIAGFTDRLKRLLPGLAQLVARRAAEGAEAKAKVASAGAAAKKGEFDEANRLLDEVQAMVGPEEEAKAEGEEEEEPTEGKFVAFLARLRPTYLSVLQGVPTEGTKMRALMMMAQEQADGGDFKKALASLKQLEKLLQSSGETEIDGIPAGLVNYRSALLAFAKAKSTAAAQIAALQKAIPGMLPDEKAVADGVANYLNAWNNYVEGTVNKAINAAKNEREPLEAATRKAIKGYLAELETNPMIKLADGNTLSPVGLRATLGAALRLIETTMAKLS